MRARRISFLRRRSPGPFFFVHVQKAAGTSLTSQLRSRFGPAAVYPDESDLDPTSTIDGRSVLSVEHLQERWRQRGSEIAVVTGHFPLCTTELLGGGFHTFSLLRDPVARTLSYLRHHRELTPEARGQSLEEIYDDPFRFEGLVHNHMVKMFSLTTSEMTEGALTPVAFGPERLEAAKRGLETVDVIGVQEDYERFCRSLERTFGWRLGDRRHMNRTRPVGVDPAFERRIAEDNADDIALYEFAVELIARRASRR